jgi:lysophospholipase L1-like esterase
VELVLRLVPYDPGLLSPAVVLERQDGLEDLERTVAAEASGAESLRANRIYREDPVTFWRLREGVRIEGKNYLLPPSVRDRLPFTMTVNPEGFRGPVLPRVPPPAALRVAAVGDSATFGWGVGDDETYPALLATKLARSFPGRRVEVWNAGIPGFSTFQGSRLLEREVLARRPSYVVLSFGFNDSRPAASTDAALAARSAGVVGTLARAAQGLQISKRLGALFGGHRTRAAPPPGEPRSFRVPVEEYRVLMRDMARAVHRASARPILVGVVMPRPYQAALRDVARELGVPLLDVPSHLLAHGTEAAFLETHKEAVARHRDAWRDVPGGDVLGPLYADPVHPAGMGQDLIAGWIAGAIRDAEGLPQAPGL